MSSAHDSIINNIIEQMSKLEKNINSRKTSELFIKIIKTVYSHSKEYLYFNSLCSKLLPWVIIENMDPNNPGETILKVTNQNYSWDKFIRIDELDNYFLSKFARHLVSVSMQIRSDIIEPIDSNLSSCLKDIFKTDLYYEKIIELQKALSFLGYSTPETISEACANHESMIYDLINAVLKIKEKCDEMANNEELRNLYSNGIIQALVQDKNKKELRIKELEQTIKELTIKKESTASDDKKDIDFSWSIELNKKI